MSTVIDTWVIDVDEACLNSTLMIWYWFEYNRNKKNTGTSLLCHFASYLAVSYAFFLFFLFWLQRVCVTNVHKEVHILTLCCCWCACGKAVKPKRKRWKHRLIQSSCWRVSLWTILLVPLHCVSPTLCLYIQIQISVCLSLPHTHNNYIYIISMAGSRVQRGKKCASCCSSPLQAVCWQKEPSAVQFTL